MYLLDSGVALLSDHEPFTPERSADHHPAEYFTRAESTRMAT